MRGDRGMSQDKKGSGSCTFPSQLPHANLSRSVKNAVRSNLGGWSEPRVPLPKAAGWDAGAGGCSGCCCDVAVQPEPALAAGRVSQSPGCFWTALLSRRSGTALPLAPCREDPCPASVLGNSEPQTSSGKSQEGQRDWPNMKPGNWL